jgi:hypothetical protein
MRYRAHLLPAADVEFVDRMGYRCVFEFGDEANRRRLYDAMSRALAARGTTYAPVLSNHDPRYGAHGSIVRLEWVADGIDAIIDLNASGVACHLCGDVRGRMDYVSGGFDFGESGDFSDAELFEVSLPVNVTSADCAGTRRNAASTA